MKRAYGLAGLTAGCLLVMGLAGVHSQAAVAATKKDDHAAASSTMKGRVETTNARRLARPEPAETSLLGEENAGGMSGALTCRAAGKKMQGAMDVNNFRLNNDQAALRAGLNTDVFGAPNSAYDPPPLTAHAFDQGPMQSAAAIDYAAIERAYAVAGVQSGSTPLQSALIALRAGMVGAVPGPTGVPLGALRVDTDNCLCNTAVPSRHCMAERTSTIYGGSYAGMAARSPVLFGGHR